ncbi:MAG: enoyl-CoA hydratase/carnithine racemase [Myxococcota bacterium]|jgi:enoyl-CoA hydratase/carnithine racemase
MSEIVTTATPHDGVALLTMNNPKILNFGSWEALGQLADAMTAAREAGARVTVLASAIPGHWFQHAWLRDLNAMVAGEEMSGEASGYFRALKELRSPDVVYIAAINGDCNGGGAELGWACDLRVAEEQAAFGQPEVQIALATGIGGTSRLARLIGRTVTAELVLDGAPMSARRIYELGGLNRVVPNGEATATSVAWAGRLATRPAGSLRVLKQMLLDNDEMHLTDALKNEQKLFQSVVATPEARETMQRIQARFDAGEEPRAVYGEPVEG